MGAWSWADENGDWLRNTLYLCERAGTISCGACPPFHQSSLEQSTLNGIELHFKHLVGTLGECFPIPALSLTDLQAACGSPVQAEGDPRSCAASAVPWFYARQVERSPHFVPSASCVFG